MHSIAVFHGPNLNKLGSREPHLYGHTTLPALNQSLALICQQQGYTLDARQTNSEAILIEWIQELDSSVVRGLVINPGGLTHTSVCLRDALALVSMPIIEVHLTNLHTREPFRRKSLIAAVVWGRIEGLGVLGYSLAVQALIARDSE